MWTDERIALLQSLVKEDLSAADIAAKISCLAPIQHPLNRNAIIGKCYRLGLKMLRAAGIRDRALKNKLLRAKRQEARAAAKALQALRPQKVSKASVRPPVRLTEPSQDIAALIAIPTSNFIGRKAGICKWPHGDCEQKATNNSYCAEHHERSRVQP